MPLNAVDSNLNLYPLIVSGWNPVNNKLTASLYEDINDVTYAVEYPLSIIREVEDFADSQVFLFKNRYGSKEDQYYRLKLEDKRIGIIFPLKVYSDPSNLPNETEDEALYRALYIAFHHLLNKTNIISNNIGLDYLSGIGRPLKIEDFYDDEVVVLVYLDVTNPSVRFDIKKVLPSLFKFGFVPISVVSDYSDIQQFVIPTSETPLFSYQVQSWLRLYNVKGDLLNEPFIFQLFDATLKVYQTPLVRFILLYQVIELLINRIGLEFYNTSDPFDTNLEGVFTANRTASSFRDIIENVESIKARIDGAMVRKEESRIRTLLDVRCGLKKADYLKLESAALSIINALTGSSITDVLYPIRNKIIHSYHSLMSNHTDMEDLLIKYNIEFELLIADVVINFH